MPCDFYLQHELGEINAEEFAQHARGCVDCKKLRAQDDRLLQMTRTLATPSASPFLWAKIENTLRAEQQRTTRSQPRFSKTQKLVAYALAASLIIGMSVSALLFRPNNDGVDQGVLAAAALQRVVQKEKEYETAIAALERATAPQLAQLPMDLMLLYRDRLATIDTQIARCREALAENPGNAHVRRYMLMALHDKKETLQELAAQREG